LINKFINLASHISDGLADKPTTIDTFSQIYGPKIEEALEKAVSTFENKDTILKYLKGGKRLRAKLALLSYFACGGKDEEEGLKVAASSELPHSASLIKDDILDKDRERRGQPTAWVQEGPLEALRTADSMILAGLDTLLTVGSSLVKTFITHWKAAWDGEAKDVSLASGLSKIEGPSYTLYFNIIKQKTASLFKMAAKLGAQAAKADEKLVELMADYGENLGVAYQLADDYVDLKKGKAETIAKLPLVTLAQVDQSIKQTIIDAVTRGKINLGEVLLGLNINAESFFLSNMRSYVEKAKEIASSPLIPDSQYKQLLAEFPEWAVAQMLKEVEQK
jgi:geranylgeranyl pyrophosphate synthase